MSDIVFIFGTGGLTYLVNAVLFESYTESKGAGTFHLLWAILITLYCTGVWYIARKLKEFSKKCPRLSARKLDQLRENFLELFSWIMKLNIAWGVFNTLSDDDPWSRLANVFISALSSVFLALQIAIVFYVSSRGCLNWRYFWYLVPYTCVILGFGFIYDLYFTLMGERLRITRIFGE